MTVRVEREAVTALAPADIMASGLCIGCGSCAGNAREPEARMAFDVFGQLKPAGPKAWLRAQTSDFARICPFSPAARNEDELAAVHFPDAKHRHPLLGRYEACHVGHVEEDGYRLNGSSGGMVSWMAAELLRRGLVDGVAHVKPGDTASGEPLFHYTLSRDLETLKAGAKSRYFPVDLSGVLTSIRQTPGRYAVVGVPCFIKAVRLACAEDQMLQERIVFTLGLVCGHMKSARMAESFAWQMDQRIGAARQFDYRVKDANRPANWYRAQMVLDNGEVHAQDWWHLADGDWGAGFFQNSACNYCDDVVAETADISFGDAWREPYSSDGRGTNVVIVRSPALLEIVDEAIAERRLALSTVDAEFVVSTQAAGFRQRREGLAYRLTWPKRGIRPGKRVEPASHGLPRQRRIIYILRAGISRWSHRMFLVARVLNMPKLYIWWARAALAGYQGLAYGRGAVGRLSRKLGLATSEGGT